MASPDSYQSGSGANSFINTTGAGNGNSTGVVILLLVNNSFYLDDVSLQIAANPPGGVGARDIGFYLYEATPSTTAGAGLNTTQLYTPLGGPLASTTFNFTPESTTSSYSTFNFSSGNLGNYLLAGVKIYLLMAGNITTTNNRSMQFGNAPGNPSGDLFPSTTNLITWNITGSNTCTPATCKTDTFNTTNGGQTVTRNNNISTLWKINGTKKAVPAPLPLVGAGLALSYSRRLSRRLQGQQASA